MLPDCPDDVLLRELGVVVRAGWELPGRPQHARAIRHLLLLVDSSGPEGYAADARQLLNLLAEVLDDAPPELLSDDARQGCRILLGLHPAYRDASPVQRRENAADYLVPQWFEAPVRDRAGTFQRRHQGSALRQVLACVHAAYDSGRAANEPYDVVETQRWYEVSSDRQIARYGETALYRIRQDGLTALELLEAQNDPEGLLSEQFTVDAKATPGVRLESITDADDKPGYRHIRLALGQPYQAGDLLPVDWHEELTFDDKAPEWGRFWVSATAMNDHYGVGMTVRFAEAARPDGCWWFSAEPMTDLNEIGPDSLEHLIEVGRDGVATHAWAPSETERRRLYGVMWFWFDGDDAENRWRAALRRLRK